VCGEIHQGFGGPARRGRACRLQLGRAQAALRRGRFSDRSDQDHAIREQSADDRRADRLSCWDPIADGPPSYTQEQWRLFVLGGINYVDTQCNDYLAALNRFYREKNTTKQQFALLGAATLGIMGAVSVAAQALAITGIAFGLATASIDNLASGLIYELPAADVIQLVRDMQTSYKSALPTQGYDNQPAAFAALQGYINICLPISIETQVANAVKQAKINIKKGDSATGAAPVVQIGPITTFSYSSDDNTTLLEKYITKSDGSYDQAKIQDIGKALKAENSSLTVVELMSGPFPDERQKVVKRLGLK